MEKPVKNGAPGDKEEESTGPFGMIVGLAALGLILVAVVFRASPSRDLAPDQRAMAMALVDRMSTQGVLVSYTCSENQALVNGPVWDKFNDDQKRGITMSLATVCENQHAGYRITVLEYESKRRLAEFNGKTFTIPKQ